MHLKTRNVNTAFKQMVEIFHYLHLGGEHILGLPSPYQEIPLVQTNSRNGPVLQIQEPVLITYTHPRERVLFNVAREANPFFHLYEAMWMLAGRNDVESLAYYCKQMREYSDDGEVLNGAYGYRWRHAYCENCGGTGYENENSCDKCNETGKSTDQLQVIIQHLKSQPNSRRAVLQMWNVEDDLLKIGTPPPEFFEGKAAIWKGSKDVCCNLSVMFSIRKVEIMPVEMPGDIPGPVHNYLDMTVTNRSNDMIWGMLGANYVHFTFLQEYIAGALGVEVGVYNHFTNNLHVYLNNWKPEEWLREYKEQTHAFYMDGNVKEYLLTHPTTLRQDTKEIEEVVEYFGSIKSSQPLENCPVWYNQFIEKTFKPAMLAYHAYKQGHYDKVCLLTDKIENTDWAMVCFHWLRKRIRKNNAKISSD